MPVDGVIQRAYAVPARSAEGVGEAQYLDDWPSAR